MGQSFLFPSTDDRDPLPLYRFLDGRTYTLDGVPGVFHHESWRVRGLTRHALYHDADGVSIVRDYSCGWYTDTIHPFSRVLALARTLGYEEANAGDS